MTPAGHLRTLTRCLTGRPPVGELAAGVDWDGVVALANRCWLTPTLAHALHTSNRFSGVPDDVVEYLDFIHERTRTRNVRLRRQLLEAIRTLNRAGLRPIILKGAIGLLAGDAEGLCRLMSDLDMTVEPAELERAVQALTEIGYAPIADDRGLARDGDAAMLELRAHAPGAGAEHGTAQSLRPTLKTVAGAQVLVPTPTAQLIHLVRHDMLKEGDYWRGRIDLRHMHDMARLAITGPVDGTALRDAFRSVTERNALATQLLTLRALFDVDVSEYAKPSATAHFQHWRRMIIATRPAIGGALQFPGHLVWGIRRMLHAGVLPDLAPKALLRRAAGILAGTNTGAKL